MTLSLIVAMDKNGVIGSNNKLPWNLPADLKRFKRLTMGHPMIMGRKTYESIGRLLPGRTSIIVTRQGNYSVGGAIISRSLEDALLVAAKQPGAEEIFIIGGGEIFQQCIEKADKLYLTRIETQVQGDVFFPSMGTRWRQIERDFFPATDTTPAFLFETYLGS